MPVTTVNSDIGPYNLALLPQGHISDLIRRSHQPYEQRLIAIARQLTHPGDVILDVGANLGNHTVYWARSGRRVIAFEPNPVTRSALVESIGLNKISALVDIRAIALGATPGAGSLRKLLENNEGAISVEATAGGDIPIFRLDDLDLPEAALIKIDVEGAEESVLTGARDTIARLRPFIIAEMHDGQSDGAAALLRDMGYRRIRPSLAFTPTFLYVPSLRAFLVSFRDPAMLRQYIYATISRVVRAASVLHARLRPFI